MKPWIKGLIIAAVQMGLVTSLGAKLVYDRATQPRVWALTLPYDPNMPIRGRYVRLQLVVEPKGIKEDEPGPTWQPGQRVKLSAEGDRLVAEAIHRKGASGYPAICRCAHPAVAAKSGPCCTTRGVLHSRARPRSLASSAGRGTVGGSNDSEERPPSAHPPGR